MENEQTLQLAVMVHKPDDAVRQAFKDNQIDVTDREDGFVYLFNADDVDLFEALEEVGAQSTSTTFEIGFYNAGDGNYYESGELTANFAEMVDTSDDDLDLTMLADLADYIIEDGRELVQSEQQRLHDKYYFNAPQGAEPEQDSPVVVHKHKADNPQTGLSPDAAKSDPTEGETVSGTTEPNDLPDEKTEGDKENNSEEDTNSEPDVPEVPDVPDIPDSPELTALDNAEIDPVLQLAASIFEQATQVDLPYYDEHTMQQLGPVYLAAESALNDSKTQAIARIYQRLKDNQDAFGKEFNDKFRDNEHEHDLALTTLEDNQETEKKKARDKSELDYKTAKDNYVAAQRPVLEAKFDSENQADFDKQLHNQLVDIDRKYDDKRQTENTQYNAFRAKEEDRFMERKFRSVKIDDIIDEYIDDANEQINHIQEQATDFTDQVAIVAHQALDERDKAKQEAKLAKQEKDSTIAGMQAEMDNKIAAGVAAQTSDLQRKVDDLTKRNAENNDLINKMNQDHAEQLRKEHEKWDARYQEQNNQFREKEEHWTQRVESAQSQLTELTKQNNSLQATNAGLQKQLETLSNQIDSYKSAAEAANKRSDTLQDQMVQSANQTSQLMANSMGLQQMARSNNEPQQAPAHSSKAGWITSAVVGAVALMGLSIGGTVLAMNHTQASQPTVVQTSNNATAPKYSNGSTWTFHDPKTGKNYTVTMDNSTQGHYTDDHGQKHVVQVENNN